MSENTVDRRVRKTKKQLQLGLVELLKEKPAKDITVREISELADINRGTFYLHYRDIFDMVEQLENEMLTEIECMLDSAEIGSGKPLPFLTKMFTYLAENASMCRVLMSENGDIAFVKRIMEIVEQRCLASWEKLHHNRDAKNYAYYIAFLVSGYLGLFETWLKNEMRETPQEMAELAEKMILGSAKVLER